MSELTPNPAPQSRAELRARSGSSKNPGLARHGRLPKPKAWPLVLGIISGTLAVLLFSSAAVAGIVFNSLYSEVKTVDLVQPTEGPIPSIGNIEGGFNILIVGSDTRAGQQGIGGSAEEETSSLNDVNMLLHVSQDQTNAVAISFPRDMVVGIPECPWADGSGDTKGYSTEPLNTALYVRDFRGNSPRFVFYTLRLLDFNQYSDKGAVPGVNRNDLHRAPAMLPPPAVQEAFDQLLSPSWARMAANERECATLAATRDLLLPRLMSGELRVRDAERAIEAVA